MAFMNLAQTLPGNMSARVLGEDVRFACAMFITYHNRDDKRMNLSSLLQQTAERGVTHKRDRVYGLLSIIKHQDSNVDWPEPDYRKETTETSVFRAYTRKIIEHERTLDILCFKKHEMSPENTSSWAFEPEYMTKLGSMLLLEQTAATHPGWSACGGTDARFTLPSSEDDSTLGLFGVHSDTVAKVFSLQSFLQRLGAESSSRLGTRWSDVHNESKRLAIEVQGHGGRVHDEEDLASAILRTLVVNDFWTLSTDPMQEYETDAKKLYSNYQASWGINLNGQASDGAGSHDCCAEQTQDDLVEKARRNFQFTSPTQEATAADAVDGMDIAVTYDLYKDLKWKLKDMQLAVSTKGRLALVPHIAGPKDKICVLLGGYFPLVLRSCPGTVQSRKNGVYRLMGPAYMRELAGGQALKRYLSMKERSPTTKPEDELELFKLS